MADTGKERKVSDTTETETPGTDELSDSVEITRVSGKKEWVTREQLRSLKRIERSSGEIQWGTRDEIRNLNRQRREEKALQKQRRKQIIMTSVGFALLFAGIVLSREGLERVRQENLDRERLEAQSGEKPGELHTQVLPAETPQTAQETLPENTQPTPAASHPSTSVTPTQSAQPNVLQSLDVKPPRIELTNAPSGTIATNDVRFQFHATNEEALFAYFLEGFEQTYSDYVNTNVRTYEDLPDHTYTFYLKAKDHAGNVTREPLTQSFTIDTTPPVAQISKGPNGTISERTVVFGFETNETADFSSQLEGFDAQFTPFDSSTMRTFYDLPDGKYTLLVRARDAVGNIQSQPTVRHFTIDTQTPNARIVSSPDAVIAQRRVEFTVGANKQAQYSYYLEGREADFGPFTDKNTVVYTGLEDGEYTFMVKARDLVGNEDPAPAIYSFRVDTQPPQVLITRGPRGAVPYDNVTFFFQPNEPSVFSYYLEGYETSFSQFTSEPSRTYHNLPDGAYTFHIRARDTAGNLSEKEATQAFSVRTTEELYSQGFEDPKLKLAVQDDDKRNRQVTWGYTTKRVHEGKYSLWCAGTGEESGKYAQSMNSWFEIPVDLSYYSQGSLIFWYYLDTTQDLTDQFVLSVRNKDADGSVPFEIFWKPLLEPNQVPRWTRQVVSLDAYVGKSVVLRFYFISDDKFEDEGVYIDSIRINGRY